MTLGGRFYTKNSVVPFEEDATHEFKGHRNIAFEDIPPWCWIPGTDRRSRKAVSRYALASDQSEQDCVRISFSTTNSLRTPNVRINLMRYSDSAISMLSPRVGGAGQMWGIWSFLWSPLSGIWPESRPQMIHKYISRFTWNPPRWGNLIQFDPYFYPSGGEFDEKFP